MNRLKYMLFLLGISFCHGHPLLHKNLTQGDIRVPVILVEYEDVKFRDSNSQSYFNDFLNKEGFKENNNFGSVRDYYIYNSMGKFRPSFDVYGPITLPNSKKFYDDSLKYIADGGEVAFGQVLDTLLSWGIDFSKYDNDGDKTIEYIAMIDAGKSEYISKALRPAMHNINLQLDNKLVFRRFAIVSELDRHVKGQDGIAPLNGISLFIHEFNHMIGLPDLYITGGTTVVGTWSVMDNPHAYAFSKEENVDSELPPLLQSVDRMLLGWLTPIEIGDADSLRLDRLDDNVAFSVTNPENENEMYLLEYRTNKKWDLGQKNSGMLVWYTDYVDSAWYNVNGGNLCSALEYLVKASPLSMKVQTVGSSCSIYAWEATSADVFPGSDNITSFDQFVFRNGLNMNITLSQITESEDKDYVTFKVSKSTPYKMEIESSSSSSAEPIQIRFPSNTIDLF
ncbi:MAG: M6 family metalloprotease domain-containing protein, partial [Fibrobacter sp.]|nr:M6 family metalloprotease domain-containing protein [Fibrobacter sp.]